MNCSLINIPATESEEVTLLILASCVRILYSFVKEYDGCEAYIYAHCHAQTRLTLHYRNK